MLYVCVNERVAELVDAAGIGVVINRNRVHISAGMNPVILTFMGRWVKSNLRQHIKCSKGRRVAIILIAV